MDYSTHIPIELMELLTKINTNITEVKERITRIEAQDHVDSIRLMRQEIEKERDERIKLQIELANVKTKLAPIIMGVSVLGAAVVDYLLKAVHT